MNDASHCDACGGVDVRTPAAPDNPAGLSRIGYRSGEYQDFSLSMTARLSSAKYGALGTLTSRELDDFTLALIDAWSASCDVLTFYNEMWLNEAYINTAIETATLHELATLIDYVPHPGVAATVDLAFTVAEGEGIPEQLTVPAGTKIQSTPGQDEKPVIYETLSDLPVRAAWNAIRPTLTAPHPLTATTTRIPLPGSSLNLKPGDAVFFVGDGGNQVFATINKVTIVLADIARDPEAIDLTWIDISPLATAPLSAMSLSGTVAVSTAFSAGTPSSNKVPLASKVDSYKGETLAAQELSELLAVEQEKEKAFFSPFIALAKPTRAVQVFRTKAAIFGHAAPPLDSLHYSLTGTFPVFDKNTSGVIVEDVASGPYAGLTKTSWADKGTLQLMDDGNASQIYLERPMSDIAKGSTVVLLDGDKWLTSEVTDNTELAAAFFTVTGKSARLALDSRLYFSQFSIRGTSVFGASEWLTIADPPLVEPLDQTAISVALNGWYPGLEAGRTVILKGEAEGMGAEPVVAKKVVQSVSHSLEEQGGTTLTFTEPIGASYLPQSLRIYANVADATQGESVVEVMDDGSATPHLALVSKQAPQTFVPAATASGVKSTMDIRVNKILWHPVPHFLNASPTDRVYTQRIDEEGYSHITFGDGVNGAMPGKGQQNIRASYRKTLGLEGRVKAGQLNLLMSQPLGVQAVKNLLDAEGGADPESRDHIRVSAPLSCRTLGRVVSLTDYADFSLSYGGIAKATSQWLHINGRQQVVVTVAAEEGAQVPEGGDLHTALSEALAVAGDPFVRFMLRSFRHRFFRLGIRLKVHADYLREEVVVDAEAALWAKLSFAARHFGQPVFASEVIAILHDVQGVEAVVVERLYSGNIPTRNDGLAAPMAEINAGEVVGATILSLGSIDYLEASL
ncbi:hypothetical protein [Veronia pacifica]|uniref:Baseplate protein J-like domain-containing protein n=1 Tax=Veronia pacifica TaxID=1080227 RepID=A0A1C3EPL1_9GAMM|nr:hypothetical protein [Veronia pacifica]ODA35165.1 hypothetical protein A8L45_04415 [Veronia pacifica]